MYVPYPSLVYVKKIETRLNAGIKGVPPPSRAGSFEKLGYPGVGGQMKKSIGCLQVSILYAEVIWLYLAESVNASLHSPFQL